MRLLADTDGDGVFDKATVFADDLSWPTGAACWKGGIFVAATPDIWYFKDTDGDGVADVRQKVFTGFKKLNVQAVMNNPIWGLDNKIYIAGGSNGGTLQNLVHPEGASRSPSAATIFSSIPVNDDDASSPAAARASATRSTTGAIASSATSATRPARRHRHSAISRAIPICRP